MAIDNSTNLVAMAHLREAPVLAGDPLVFGLDGEFVLGSGVV